MKFYCRGSLKSENPRQGCLLQRKGKESVSFNERNVEFMLNCLTEKVKRKHFVGSLKMEILSSSLPPTQCEKSRIKSEDRKHETRIENISLAARVRVHFKSEPRIIANMCYINNNNNSEWHQKGFVCEYWIVIHSTAKCPYHKLKHFNKSFHFQFRNQQKTKTWADNDFLKLLQNSEMFLHFSLENNSTEIWRQVGSSRVKSGK